MANFTITLKEAREVADRTYAYTFTKPEGYTFTAGQYVALMLPKTVVPDARGPVRSFSISSAPCEADLLFSMRGGESGFKQTFLQMKPGDAAMITKAVGFFVEPKEDQENLRPIVFLVGGIGITPVRSILKQAEHDKSRREYILIYSNRFAKDAAFDEELRNLKLPNFRYVQALSMAEEQCAPENDERGFICASMLKKYVDDTAKPLYYMVGSPAFIGAMEAMLIELGVPKEQWKEDPFTGLTTHVEK